MRLPSGARAEGPVNIIESGKSEVIPQQNVQHVGEQSTFLHERGGAEHEGDSNNLLDEGDVVAF